MYLIMYYSHSLYDSYCWSAKYEIFNVWKGHSTYNIYTSSTLPIMNVSHIVIDKLDLLSYSIARGIPVALTIVKCWNTIIRAIDIRILMNLMIKMMNLIDVIPYMTTMTDISTLDNRQCHWNSTGNWVTELVYCYNIQDCPEIISGQLWTYFRMILKIF